MSEVTRPTDAALAELLEWRDCPTIGSLWCEVETGQVWRVVCMALDRDTCDRRVVYQLREFPRVRHTELLAAWSRPGRFVPWEPGENP